MNPQSANFVANNDEGKYRYRFPSILSTEAAYGKHYTTEEMIDALIKNRKDDPSFEPDFATRVLNKCGYKAHSVALDDINDLFRRFTRTDYLQHREQNLIGLAERVGNEALESWNGKSSDITHLLWGTMTGGMHSPSIDVKLVKRLGLCPDVERTNIEGMGCLTGFRLLNLARQVAIADPNARVLVLVADLRSALGNSMPKESTRKDIVSVCLFRDGASATIVGGTQQGHPGEQPSYEVICGLSRVVDDSHEMVDYHETDDGSICLHLDRKLPDHIAWAEPDFVAKLIDMGKSVLDNVPSIHEDEFDILCHTGGPRVL